MTLAVSTAGAQTLDAQLASAESKATAAEQQVSEATAATDSAQAKLTAISPKASAAANQSAAALTQVETLEAQISQQRTDALAEVTRIDKDYNDDKKAHDDAVSSGLGFGIGAVGLGLLPLFWSRFRRLGFVQDLSEGSWWRALAIVGGVALVLLLCAGAMLSGPAGVRAVGGFVAAIAIGGAASLLLARHSLRVERKEDASLLSRQQLPRWVTIVVAALVFLLAGGGLGAAVSSDTPTKPTISAETKALADAAAGDPLDPPTPELLAARQAAEPLTARSDKLQSRADDAQSALAGARQKLRQGRRNLSRDRLTASRLSARIARQAARQQALAAPPPSSSGGSSGSSAPNYSSCATAPSNIAVPPGSPLDADGDGIGCES